MLRSTLTAVKSLSLIALMIAVVSISTAYAQAGSANVTGTVTDAQGAVVAGATVRLLNESKGFTRTAMTNNSGQYSFSSVPADTYSIEIEAAGFKKLVRTNVTALVDRTTDANAVLEAGSISEVVNVSGGDLSSIVNTQDASLGNNFVAQQISQLPLEGRNVADLLSLQPGVTPGGSVTGGRSDQANITLDGIDVNNQQEGTAFSPVLRVTPDSIEEFRVTTSNPDASKGRSSGAQISLLTKSGSNNWHGNLFEYHRNDYFNANEWFNNAAGNYAATDLDVINGLAKAGDERLPRPPLIRNLFGGSLGGPIVKDRFFFFYNYEGMRERKSEGRTRLVPLASLGQGTIRFTDTLGVVRSLNAATINNLVDSTGNPVVNINPFVLGVFADAASRYPANFPEFGDDLNTGGFRFNAPLPVDNNTHTARFDWNVTSDQRHTISLRGNYQKDIFGGAPYLPDTPPTNQWSHPNGLAASHTWLINNRMTNRFSYGMSRLSFSNQGDSSSNAITFRDIFQSNFFARTFSRVNPTHNIANDLTWVKGDHTWQFGTNIRITRNKRTSLASAFDNGVTNFGFYQGSGSVLINPLDRYLTETYGTPAVPVVKVASSDIRFAQSSLAAVLGRLNQYTANFAFDKSGKPLGGEPTVREFATEEYDFYMQDSWRVKPSLTLNFGVRYGYSTPVYETQGFEVAPNIALDDYFAARLAAAEVGGNYTAPLIFDVSGKVNNRPPMYDKDTNNWQPRISFAWSPKFEGGLGGFLFGRDNDAVLRGGFAITNDYYGQQLAVTFDTSNTLGFNSSFTVPANTFNITTAPAPLITSLNMDIRQLPGVVVPANLVFPLQQPANNARRIEHSIDRGIQAPIHYSWNLTYGRTLPGKLYIETSYIGRRARNLLATRDVMSPNNIRDPLSGQTYYEAASILEAQRRAGVPWQQITALPFWENIYPTGSLDNWWGWGGGISNTQVVYQMMAITNAEAPGWEFLANSSEWTFLTHVLDATAGFHGGGRKFYQSQYGALSSFGSIANSDYHGGTLSIRQRLSGVTWDFNYTLSHSMDDTSGLQTSTGFGTAFILNPIRQSDNYASSDFDMRHLINFNALWELPFGRGKRFGSGINSFANAVLGGWQLSTIARYNSGQPIGTGAKIFDNSGWATNWNLKSAGVQIRPIQTGVNLPSDGGLPNLFADPDAAYASFRTPFPGETGDRNQLRYPAFYTLDLGLAKSFTMPWKENHKLGLRWDVFNVTNTPIFAGNSNTALGWAPNEGGGAPNGFGTFTGSRVPARVMQFAIRYDF